MVQYRIELPTPRLDSETSIEKALLKRRSIREYIPGSLTLQDVGQLLWAAQGITHSERGFRTAPSAGALFPLEVYAVAGQVEGLAPGVYKYLPHDHALAKVTEGDVRKGLAADALGQEWVEEAPLNIVLTAVYRRTTRKYGDRGIQYVHMEIGIAAQNVYLQAVALGLGTVFVGAFIDDRVSARLQLPSEERPLCILPVGRLP